MADDIATHNVEIHQNRTHWLRKPMLRDAYAEFYRLIAQRLDGNPASTVVECGSGIGNLKSAIPFCVTTDLFPNPWIDRTENAYALSFADDSVSAVILFDVFHHLEHPGTALDEMRRVLRVGGRLVLFEPAMGLLGRTVLGAFHHEPLGLGQPLPWRAPAGWSAAATRYYAAQANAWRAFRRREQPADLQGWRIAEVSYFPALAWLLAGGFRGPQLCPHFAMPALKVLDRVLSLLPSLFAARMLVVLEKV